MVQKYIPLPGIFLSYNKRIVDLCFDSHGVLLNFEINHIDFHFASVNMKFTEAKKRKYLCLG